MTYQHTATSDGVYHQLREQLVHLELLPGSSISEIETAEKYHISRTPVRDAFKRLEREGLLEIRPHIGTFVSLIDMNEVADVLYTREVLEYAVLCDLSQRCDKSLDANIRLVLQKQKDLLESGMDVKELSRAFIKSDNGFHAALFEAAGHKNIPNFLSSINCQYERFRTFINFSGRSDLYKLYETHVQIWEYVTHKDTAALRDCLTHHLYDGFNANKDIVVGFPEYFKTNE